jgi:hypothetical protein
LFLKSKGLIFKIPLKVYDEGLLIQKALASTPSIVPFRGISSIEFFFSRAGARCAVSSIDGSHRSVENFSSAGRMKEFVLSIEPALGVEGFTMRIEEDGGSFRASFRKSIMPPSILRPPSP